MSETEVAEDGGNLSPPDKKTRDECVLILAPSGSDAYLACAALKEAGLEAEACRRMEDLCQQITDGAGAVLIAREALTPQALDALGAALGAQPPWSDLPLLILTGSASHGAETDLFLMQSLDRLGNAAFLERPLRVATLVRAVKVALRSRHRQYEIREHLRERAAAEAERTMLLEKQRALLRDVLFSVTEGKLRLCDRESELPLPLTPVGEPIVLEARTLRMLRRRVCQTALSLGFSDERAQDFVTSVGESSMNAVVHADGGMAWVSADPSAGVVQVRIEDRGQGINIEHLPRATLERGYSSAGTMGHGFYIILKTVSRLYLLTGPGGTTLVLEQEPAEPPPPWFASLSDQGGRVSNR